MVRKLRLINRARLENAPTANPITAFPEPDLLAVETMRDLKVCNICDGLDGVEYDESDPDLPVPPMHPNCRCELVDANTGETVVPAAYSKGYPFAVPPGKYSIDSVL